MSDTKSTKRRVVGLGDSESVHLRLTTPQADWLRSTAKREAISIASVVRGMIDAERVEEEPQVVRGSYGMSFREAMAQPGGDPSKEPGRCATRFQDGWAAYLDGCSKTYNLTESQAIAWCLKGVLP